MSDEELSRYMVQELENLIIEIDKQISNPLSCNKENCKKCIHNVGGLKTLCVLTLV